ncbi:hypothetical protein DUNSADRAFT_13994 [Dunaliella salina]|uniref:Secreted protein n=1 Tax=Dunaliella salina TaxID=3046 RepID=A0ABQ7G863_DUNSA|nr:hypothetical protein DUNSADRAFT_13994 [Dunaliella salina]|eukprot:KAF5830804.1 hypothetical protein DUNSADRAFT_13994 [Dunaliella salina]
MLKAIVPLSLFFTLTRRMVLARAVKFTYGVLRLPYSLVTIAKRRPKWVHATTMPVAGIDALCGQSILFCLQRSIIDVKDEDVPGLWLQALHVAQVLSDRLLQDLALVERHLEWWSRQFQRGTSHWSHFRFMLLGRGPISFLIDVSRLLIGCTKPMRRAFRAARCHSLPYGGRWVCEC